MFPWVTRHVTYRNTPDGPSLAGHPLRAYNRCPVRVSFAVLILLAACASEGEPLRAPAPSSILEDEPSRAPVPSSTLEHEAVAWINGAPITRAALLESVLRTDYKRAVDRHAAGAVVLQRLRTLGIAHTPEALLRRARAHVAEMKAELGAEAFETQLKRSGMSEDQYARRWARMPSLSIRLSNEKAAVYDQLREGFARVDTKLFRAGAAVPGPGRTPLKRRTGVRVSRSVHPPWLTPAQVERILAADPADEAGQKIRVDFGPGRGVVEVTVRGHEPGDDRPYAQLKERVFDEILRRPPQPDELEGWVRALLKRSEIRYDDRFYQPRD